MTATLRSSLAEAFGTALLVAAIVGSGLMAERLSDDRGVMLLMNVLSTVLVLALLIALLLPLSGAHLNPVVTLVSVLCTDSRPHTVLTYGLAQCVGAVSGTVLAHVMFGEQLLQTATLQRASLGTLVGEVVATTGLIVLIGVMVAREQHRLLPLAVASWIAGASLFTSSASFANPAVTLGRALTDSFTGIAPSSVLPYVGAQAVGAFLGLVLLALLQTPSLHKPSPQKETVR